MLTDVHFTVVDNALWNLNLDISSSFVIHIFRNLNNKLLDKGCHVVIRNDFCFPLLDTEYFFIDMDLHIFLHLHLAAQAFVCSNFLAGKVWYLGRQDISSPFEYVAGTLDTGSTSTTGRGQKDSTVAKCTQERAATIYFENALTVVDINLNFS